MGKHTVEELKAALKQAENDGAEEVDLDEQEEDEQGGQTEDVVEANVERMAEKLADRIAGAITEKTRGSERDRGTLREKFLSKGHGLDAVEYPADLKGLKDLNTDERIVVFFKSLVQRKDDAESDRVFKALVEGTDAEGGYLVPEEFAAEVFRILPDSSVMRRIARVMPMNRDTLNLNTLAARPTAYWTEEYASKSTTSAEFGRVVLSPNKLVCLLPVTQELLADANINLVNFIVQLFSEEIGRTEDKAYFTGSGTGQPKGISTETLTTVAAGGVLDFDDVISLIHKPAQAVRQSNNAAIVAHKYVIEQLRKVKDTNGNYIWREGTRGGAEITRMPDTAYGYPVYEQNDLDQDQMYFGDWSQYVIGDRQQLTVMTTMEGGDAWRRDSMEIKAKIRVDGKTVLTSAFAKITGINS